MVVSTDFALVDTRLGLVILLLILNMLLCIRYFFKYFLVKALYIIFFSQLHIRFSLDKIVKDFGLRSLLHGIVDVRISFVKYGVRLRAPRQGLPCAVARQIFAAVVVVARVVRVAHMAAVYFFAVDVAVFVDELLEADRDSFLDTAQILRADIAHSFAAFGLIVQPLAEIFFAEVALMRLEAARFVIVSCSHNQKNYCLFRC